MQGALNWLDPQQVVDAFGGYAVLVVTVLVFFETAFIFTSFLPGDSLLFIVGVLTVTTITSVVMTRPTETPESDG